MIRLLFGGDPIERAIAARMLGHVGPPARPELSPNRIGALLEAMDGDPYPAVRTVALRSLKKLVPGRSLPLGRYEPTGLPEERHAAIGAIVAAMPRESVQTPDPVLVANLRAAASHKAIHIGE
jgi:hypothetical protein